MTEPAPPEHAPPMHAPSVHATCIALGDRGVLIRGPSGSGKSTLALQLLLDPPRALPLAELVADDRVLLRAAAGRVWARPVPALAGLLEVRGLGVRRWPHRDRVSLSHVVDLASPLAARLPSDEAQTVRICDVALPCLRPVCLESAALLLAAAWCSQPYEN